LIGCDRATKTAARQTFASSGGRSYLDGMVRFEYAENPGAFLSLGEHLPYPVRMPVIALLAAGVLAGTVFLCFRIGRLPMGRVLAFALILGGAFGNLLDRILNQGRVIDFVVLTIGPVRTGVFNLADVLITGGVTFLLVRSFVYGREEPDC
jgi:signal peptidase II